MRIAFLLVCITGSILLTSGSNLWAKPQTDWYVDGSVAGPGTGTQVDPYSSIEFAMAQGTTVAGDTLQVAPGIYVGETLDFLGKELRLVATNGPGTVTVQGPGTSPSDAPHAPGSGGRALVRLVNDEGAGTAIEGFRIVGGLGEDRGTDAVGGAIYMNGGHLSLVDCEIEGKAHSLGGAVYCNKSILVCQNTELR